MPVNHVGHHATSFASPEPSHSEEAGRGRPATMVPSAPLQSLRRASGAVASSMVGALRQTSALTTAALVAVASEVLPSGAEAARVRPGVPPSRGTPYRSAPPPPSSHAGAPPRKVMELPSPGSAGLGAPGALPTDPLLVASAVVGTAMGVGALAGLGVAAYKRWAGTKE